MYKKANNISNRNTASFYKVIKILLKAKSNSKNEFIYTSNYL